MARHITQCPVCDSALQVSELTCSACATRLQGAFPATPLARLPQEHQRFVETFLLCRGVIRDVERELGVSYPTVRARLDAAVAALETALIAEAGPMPPPAVGNPVPAPPDGRDERRRRLLREVEEGRLTPAEAAEALRRL